MSSTGFAAEVAAQASLYQFSVIAPYTSGVAGLNSLDISLLI